MTVLRFLCATLLLGMIALTSCVAPLETPPQDETFTVISGVLTNSLGERVIQVRSEGGFSGSIDPIPASGVIYENDEIWGQFIEDSTGYLSLPIGLQFTEGNSYYIEITANNQVYRTLPQVVQPRLNTDTMSFNLDVRTIGTSSDGRPIEEALIDVFVHVDVPQDLESPLYYRWQVDEVWAFNEVAKPAFQLDSGEIDIINTCYLSASVQENVSTLLNSNDVGAGEAILRVASRPIDESFLQRHVYSAYLHALDKRAYDYYERSRRLGQIDGSLYDELPAAVRGNVFNANTDSELVLGYVEISTTDTFRLNILRDQIDYNWYDQCRPPEDAEADCNFPPQPPGDTSTVYCKCYDCWRIYGRGTLERPFWW